MNLWIAAALTFLLSSNLVLAMESLENELIPFSSVHYRTPLLEQDVIDKGPGTTMYQLYMISYPDELGWAWDGEEYAWVQDNVELIDTLFKEGKKDASEEERERLQTYLRELIRIRGIFFGMAGWPHNPHEAIKLNQNRISAKKPSALPEEAREEFRKTQAAFGDDSDALLEQTREALKATNLVRMFFGKDGQKLNPYKAISLDIMRVVRGDPSALGKTLRKAFERVLSSAGPDEEELILAKKIQDELEVIWWEPAIAKKPQEKETFLPGSQVLRSYRIIIWTGDAHESSKEKAREIDTLYEQGKTTETLKELENFIANLQEYRDIRQYFFGKKRNPHQAMRLHRARLARGDSSVLPEKYIKAYEMTLASEAASAAPSDSNREFLEIKTDEMVPPSEVSAAASADSNENFLRKLEHNLVLLEKESYDQFVTQENARRLEVNPKTKKGGCSIL